MKSPTKLLLTIFLGTSLAWAQPVQQQGYDFTAPTPQGATNIRAGVSGGADTRAYHYWVVSIFPRGSSLPNGPASVLNGPQTLSSTNKIIISWNAAPGATSYVVVRNSNTTNPLAGGSCASCLVASGITSTSTEDTGAALSSYTLGASIPVATGRLELNNRDFTSPLFQFSDYWAWQPVGAGALANRPSTCTANRDVYICNGSACSPSPRIDFCTSANNWTSLSQSVEACSSVTGDDDYVCGATGDILVLNVDVANTGAATLDGDPIYWPRAGEDPPDNAIRVNNYALLVKCTECPTVSWILQENANGVSDLSSLSGTLDISSQSNLGTTNAGGVCVVTGDNINCKATYDSEGLAFTNPVTGHSGFNGWHVGTSARTITRVWCFTRGGGTETVTIQLDERTEAGVGSPGTDIMSSALVCDHDGQATTAFDNAGIAANSFINLDIDAVANSPTGLMVFYEYSFQ